MLFSDGTTNAATASTYLTVSQSSIQDKVTVAIGATQTSNEANLFLGARGTAEGGQIALQKATNFHSSSMLDNYQNRFRVLRGNDTASTAEDLSVNHTNGQLILPKYTSNSSFTGTSVGGLGFDSSGKVLTLALESGAYNPTVAGSTSTCNTSGAWGGTITNACAQYMRVGSVVTVSGMLLVTTGEPGTAAIYVTLPVSSNVGFACEIAGTAVGSCKDPNNVYPQVYGRIYGDPANERAIIEFYHNYQNGTVFDFSYHFTYIIN